MDDTSAESPPSSNTAETTLRCALFDSRQRWRDLVLLSADLAYETDANGRFVFITPDLPLGWQAETLIGQPAELLLVGGAGSDGFNPFRVTMPVRRRRSWFRCADGTSVMLAVSAVPLFDAQGQFAGTRGTGVDFTEFDRHSGRVASSLRRGEVLDHILWRMSQEVMAPRMMQAVLDALMNALGCEGVGVIEPRDSDGAVVAYCAGGSADAVLPALTPLLHAADRQIETAAAAGRPIAVVICHTRFGGQPGLALWRSPGSRDWDRDDKQLMRSAASVIRMVLEHEAIQKEMARQARTDPLTGLLNRRAFLEEMARHIDRLNREDQPGTLMFADLDRFKPVNDQLGHEVGDLVLLRTAAILRDAVRPTDLVARLGGDEFALWLDGADHMTSAERAEQLCVEVPKALQPVVGDEQSTPGMSIGIASRSAGSGEAIDDLLRRADKAMYEVKRSGRGHWHVAGEDMR
jgi:diguanylate cyclase (GGDEF)-like protein